VSRRKYNRPIVDVSKAAEPEEIRRLLEDGICPICGCGPYRVVAGHAHRVHDVDRHVLREMGHLTKSAVICDEDHHLRMVARGKANPDALRGSDGCRHPRTLSTAGRESQRRKALGISSEVHQKASAEAHRRYFEGRVAPALVVAERLLRGGSTLRAASAESGLCPETIRRHLPALVADARERYGSRARRS
jgi:hypothetical protein